MLKRILLTLTFAVSCSASLAVENKSADVIYTNARIYTVNRAQPWANAMAIKGNRIVAVGDASVVKAYRGKQTRIEDLTGKLVLPGLVEEHVHPDMASENLVNINLQPSEMSWQEQQQGIVDYAKSHPGEDWLMGGMINWLNDNGNNIDGTDSPSHFSTLDALVPDRPLMMWDVGGHAVLLNKAGLTQLGITASTPNPAGGVIVKDSDGQPTGVLRETAANMAYERALDGQPRGRELIESGLKPVLKRLSEFGITSISDSWGRDYMVKAYREMALANELPVRIKVYVSDPLEWVDEQWRKGAQSIIDNHEDYRVGNWLRADGVKFVLDGSAGGQTLIMVEPYEGTTDQHGGPWRNDPEEFAKKLLEYDARGLTVKAHAVGSQTIRTVLDAMEAVRARGSKQRHSVAHTVFVHPDDRDRFKTLDVIAEFSPYFWYPTPSWDMLRHELGERRLEWVFPFKTFTDMGVKVSVGSDWPVVDSPNPFPAIETMISRQLPGGSEVTGPGAAQRVSLQTAIHALTMGGAYAQGREHLIGSLEAGKLADFIVLDQNLFEIDVQAIHKTRVLKTVVDGRTVFER
jgi:predicted amidohydrolase YtcJ